MMTVGDGIMSLTPVAAWVVVVAQSLVLFLFASAGLEAFLEGNGLPSLPLVPVSSSQAVVGAVIGIGLLQGGRSIRWSLLGRISSGWVATPVMAAGICFISLFFLQNVFDQQVYQTAEYRLSPPLIERIADDGIDPARVEDLRGERFDSEMAVMKALAERTELSYQERFEIARLAKVATAGGGSEHIGAVESPLTAGQDRLAASAPPAQVHP
jgi:PiT family inorganic phosphate transporter